MTANDMGKCIMSTGTIDPAAYVSRAHACRITGLSIHELGSLITSGLIGTLAIPGHKSRIKFEDIDKALRFLSAPSLIEEIEFKQAVA
jgi:hypothetical protein